MPLPEEYLAYPHRSYGMDHDRYPWLPSIKREPVALDDGSKLHVNIIVPLEFFPLNPPAEPFKHPGAMATPYPDLRHYTVRDYGNRVGVYRLLRLFDELGVTATFVINAEVARRYPPLIQSVRAAGHEIAAHGVSTAHIHHAGLSLSEEKDLVDACRLVLPEATTWMSPARSQSFHTLDLLAEAGFTACLDWEIDQAPVAFKAGDNRIVGVPNHIELSDWTLLADKCHSEDEWAEQICEAAQLLVAEHDQAGAQSFGFTLTPYIAGQPFRITALRKMLTHMAATPGLRFAKAADTATAFCK